MSEQIGRVQYRVDNGCAQIEFSSPKANSLSRSVLTDLSRAIDRASADLNAQVVLIRSAGDGTFCAGASFAELQSVTTEEEGTHFFLGFAEVILSIRNCKKIVVSRVHGRMVGGGVGIVAAADYSLGLAGAAGRLSEFDLGIGPFVVGAAVQRKLGIAAFQAMSIDCGWRSAEWLRDRGLFAEIYDTVAELDQAVERQIARIVKIDPVSKEELKKLLWHGTEDWSALLANRAKVSGMLALKANSQRNPDS